MKCANISICGLYTIDPELKEQVIEFKVIDVDEWADASNSDVTPENAGE